MIRNILKGGNKVWFLGIDQQELPVIAFEDARRKTEPFTIFRAGFSKATGEPHYPLRDLTEQEQDLIEPSHHELLSRCIRERT